MATIFMVAVQFDSNEIFSSSSFVTSIRLSVSTLQSFRISSWATSSPGVGIDFCIFDTMTGLAVNLIELIFSETGRGLIQSYRTSNKRKP